MSDTPMETPSKTITIGSHRLSMTYGLLMDVSRMLPDPAATLQLVMNDSFTQDYIVRRMFTPATATVTSIEDLTPASEIELDSDEIEALLSWVVQHTLYFFIKRTQGLRRIGEQFQQALPSHSSIGSEDSPSSEPSAGPSTV